MVARTPPKQRKTVVAPLNLNPALLRETLNKVEKCMARLQELQYTVAGGTKVISGVSLSPRSTRGYLRTSLRCKQESLRMKNATPRKSVKSATAGGEWRRMSLPAMLVGETVGEILQASQFAREILAAAAVVDDKTLKKKKTTTVAEDPQTPPPMAQHRKLIIRPQQPEDTELRARRQREKQNNLQLIRTESDSPSLQRACSRINFKVSPPPKFRENNRHMANRVSPRNKPWGKKTVLFPNPLFSSASAPSQSQHQHKFCKTRSPVIAGNRQTPHKFLIKSPPPVVSISPTRSTTMIKKLPKVSAAASKLRRSFSPSRLANRLVSPLKSRKSLPRNDEHMSGLKQRPVLMPMPLSTGRI